MHTEAEQARRASEARCRLFIEQCTEGVWSIDIDGVTDFVNPQMARMLGLEVGDMLGRPYGEFMSAEAQGQAERHLRRCREGQGERHPFKLRRRDGSEVWTQMVTSPIHDETGRYLGALALVEDITEQRRLAESIQQKQKLESLGMLAGGVAHDFNNLLVGILSNADMLLSTPDLPTTLTTSLKDIQRASLQASQLTHQLLAYAGRSHFRAERLDLVRLVLDVVGMLRAAVSTLAEVELSLDERLPPVRGDVGQLTQVLMNLVVNASDALGGQAGRITISAGVAEAGDGLLARGYVAEALGTGRHVWLRVADTGAGMDAETVRRVFDPFFSTKESGHGLGLAAVLGILRRHKGGIVIESEPGRGSEFTMLLPVASDQQEPSAPKRESTRPPASRLVGVKVLVIDDQSMVRSVARQLLEMDGAEVDEAENGGQGLAMVGASKPPGYDVLLLDLSMPGMNGAQVLSELRSRGHRMPVVVMSGYSDTEVPSYPAVSFLSKPFRAKELLRAVLDAL